MKSYWNHFFIDNGDIALIESGIQQTTPEQTNHYSVEHDYVIHLILDGKGYFNVGQNNYQLAKFDCFVLKKGQVVEYYPDTNTPWTIAWIALGGHAIHHYLNDTLIAMNDTFTLSKDSSVYQQIIELVELLGQVNHQQTCNYLQIISLVYHLLAQINCELPLNTQQTPLQTQPIPQIARDVYHYITTHFDEILSIEAIANHFDISRNYLFQLCKKYYHHSPKKLLLDSKMSTAAQLLRQTADSISEIAEAVGYRDTFQFSKMFKQYFGHSPSQYRTLSDAPIDSSLLELPLTSQAHSLLKAPPTDDQIWL